MHHAHLTGRLLPVLMIGSFLYGCDKYQTGYQDGYSKKAENNWIIFDRTGYKQGYHAGQAEVFQSEWVTENTYEDDGFQCRDIIVKADPLMFLPEGYRRVTTGSYELKK
jgi:hypothetical protein